MMSYTHTDEKDISNSENLLKACLRLKALLWDFESVMGIELDQIINGD